MVCAATPSSTVCSQHDEEVNPVAHLAVMDTVPTLQKLPMCCHCIDILIIINYLQAFQLVVFARYPLDVPKP